MTPELQRAYEESTRPFVDGAIGTRETSMKSWRYFLEINSACTLECPTCTKGNKEGYDHKNGIMDTDMMNRIIDKIAQENPSAIVFLYGNSEPFVHPHLAECITAVKSRGLRCEFSTNLNFVRRLGDVIAARPDFVIISVSGFTQEVYVKGHAGGNIEKVKLNMEVFGAANEAAGSPVSLNVNYHLYKDNAHELEPMREYAKSCGMNLFVSTARAISMENAIQYCREKEGQESFDAGGWILPHTTQQFRDTMDRLKIPPTQAKEMYRHLPIQPVCPVGSGGMFTFIRHDGGVCLCPCVADRRLRLTDYLNSTPDSLIGERKDHAICQQCKTYKLNYYFHIVDRSKWD
jgi:MoaA/NifB/PqqE/SkfB family radical SAM enzyme